MLIATVSFPETGMSLPEARKAIDALRGRRFVNRMTGIVAQLSSSAKGKLEAIKVEALDRIVEVVSGNTPHASSASTQNRITSLTRFVNWLWACLGLVHNGRKQEYEKRS